MNGMKLAWKQSLSHVLLSFAFTRSKEWNTSIKKTGWLDFEVRYLYTSFKFSAGFQFLSFLQRIALQIACGREERNLLALYLKERKEKIDIALPGRSKCTFVTEVSREEITLNGLPVLLSPLQKGRSDSLIGEDLIKRPMASRIRSFIWLGPAGWMESLTTGGVKERERK